MSDEKQQRQDAIAAAMADIGGILKSGPIDRATLSRISARLQHLTEFQSLFPLTDFPPPAAGSEATSCRYQLFHDPATNATLYLNAIIPGKNSAPHNHGTWAVISALEGEELNKLYDRLDDGSDPDFASIEVKGEYIVKPGSPLELLPDDVHSIHVMQGPAVRHLHLYGQPLETLTDRIAIDLATGKVTKYNQTHMRATVSASG